MKVGDRVSLVKWDATVPPNMHLGLCVIERLYNAKSQSGVLCEVMNDAGTISKGLDIAWLTELDPNYRNLTEAQ